jgi:hypothetical protein
VTTLRFEGSQGTQPLGIARSTAAAYLLWCWVQYLKAPIDGHVKVIQAGMRGPQAPEQ